MYKRQGSGSNRVGVRGSAAGTNGTGVLGVASRGVLGQGGGANGVGVVGKNTATSGTGSGIRGFAFSPAGQGVYAENSAASGAGTALHAKSSTDTTALVESVSGNADAVGLKATADGRAWKARVARWACSGRRTTPHGSGLRVRGFAGSDNHIALSGTHSGTGIALETIGGISTNSAGKTTIASGSSSVTVTPTQAPVGANTLVVATLQSDPGGTQTVSRVYVNAGADNFAIRLTASAGQECTVGWVVLN